MKIIFFRRLYPCFFLCVLISAAPYLNAQTPVVSFAAANGGSIQEGVGGVIMSVSITNPNANETTVQILHMGTATYGPDYTYFPDTIVFPPGFSGDQFLHLNLPDDCVDESNETIILMLANPTNGAQLGIATITITLVDDDSQPVESCTYAIPANISVVTSPFSYFSHNGKFWVCQTGDLRLRSNNNLAVVEDGGVVHAEKNNNAIYVKAGGTALVQGGAQNVIYAEDGATVTVQSGLCNTVFATSGVIYSDSGTGTVREDLTCAPLAIDYTLAPMPGCQISSARDPIHSPSVDIFPNPTTGSFAIRHTADETLEHLEVFDHQGMFLGELPTDHLRLEAVPGIYFLRCVFKNGVVIRRIVVSDL